MFHGVKNCFRRFETKRKEAQCCSVLCFNHLRSGKHLSKEHKEKLRITTSKSWENPQRKDCFNNKETRKKMPESAKKRFENPEQRFLCGKSFRNKQHTEEQKRKISEGVKNHIRNGGKKNQYG